MSDELLGTQGERVAARYELTTQAVGFGLAETWRAVDAQSSHRVMVKLLSATAASAGSWPSLVARLRALGSPHLPAYLDGGAAPDARGRPRLYLVFEEIEGRTLANWLDGHIEAATSPGPAVVLRLFEAIGRAVQVGHGLGGSRVLVHAGLSPSSVVMKSHPGGHHVWVLDHGLAPFVGTASLWEHMAPEQKATTGRETPATDVFAMGVILAQLFTGCPRPKPEARETWWQWAQREHPRGDFKRLFERVHDDISDAVTDTIAQALHRDPTKRFADAQQLARKLRQAQPAAWKLLPAQEPEPPFPTRPVIAEAPPPEPRKGESAGVPIGWQEPERRPPVVSPEPSPAPPSVVSLQHPLGGLAIVLEARPDAQAGARSSPPEHAITLPSDPATELDNPPAAMTVRTPRLRSRGERPVEAHAPRDEQTLELSAAESLPNDWWRAFAPRRATGEADPQTALVPVPRALGLSSPASPEGIGVALPIDDPASAEPATVLMRREDPHPPDSAARAFDAPPVWPTISLQAPLQAPPYAPSLGPSAYGGATPGAPPGIPQSHSEQGRATKLPLLLAGIGAALVLVLVTLALAALSR